MILIILLFNFANSEINNNDLIQLSLTYLFKFQNFRLLSYSFTYYLYHFIRLFFKNLFLMFQI